MCTMYMNNEHIYEEHPAHSGLITHYKYVTCYTCGYKLNKIYTQSFIFLVFSLT